VRFIAAVLALGIMGMSPCWAHGHASALGAVPVPERSSAEPQKPFRDWLEPDTHQQKNPYENMSCPQLYVLATQGEQSSDLADAFRNKDCHAL
jgi:hypothetical protein